MIPDVIEGIDRFTVMPANTNYMEFKDDRRRIIFGGYFMSEIDMACARLARGVLANSETTKLAFTHEVAIKFLTPAREGDTVVIHTALTNLTRRGVEISFESFIEGDETLLAKGALIFVAHNGENYAAHGMEMPNDQDT